MEEDAMMDRSPSYGIPDFGVTTFFIHYGWYIFGLVVLYGAFRHRIDAAYLKWRRRRDEFEYSAKYHKDSDLAKSTLEALTAAREKMQREHEIRAAEAERIRIEKEQKKRAELAAQRAEAGNGPYSLASSSKSGLRAEYMPLMGDTGSGGYKPPKKSCCKKGGGCG